MKITWLGQAGLLFETDNITIMIDPYLSESCYKVNPNFKSLKTYILCLYYVNNGKSYPMIEEEITVKEVDGNVPEKELNSKFLEAIFDYVASDEFRDLVNGKLNI